MSIEHDEKSVKLVRQHERRAEKRDGIAQSDEDDGRTKREQSSANQHRTHMNKQSALHMHCHLTSALQRP